MFSGGSYKMVVNFCTMKFDYVINSYYFNSSYALSNRILCIWSVIIELPPSCKNETNINHANDHFESNLYIYFEH